LTAMTKKVVNFSSGKKCPPEKNPAGAHGYGAEKGMKRSKKKEERK